MAELGLASK